MASPEVYAIAREALEIMARSRGPDTLFTFDEIWEQTEVGKRVPSTSRPAQANRLIRDGYIERTGRIRRSPTPSRAGNQAAEYRFGERLRRALNIGALAGGPRLEGLHITNYRALRDVRITPMTALVAIVGANGTGKSTIFDALSFLKDCFTLGLRQAWEERGGLRELGTKGLEQEPITIEISYREGIGGSLLTYSLAIQQHEDSPIIKLETLRQEGDPRPWLEFEEGVGTYRTEDGAGEPKEAAFGALDVLAVGTLGQFPEYRRIAALYRLLTGWYRADLKIDSIRAGSQASATSRLSPTGDNLAQVIQYLKTYDPDRLLKVVEEATAWIPLLSDVTAEKRPDGRMVLQLFDRPFAEPILAQFASEGTLKMLAYLTVLNEPEAPPLIGLEEPENFLNPRLLGDLAEACRVASDQPQLLVTTHSPFFVNALQPDEVWVLARNSAGYTEARRALDIPGIPEFMEHGAQLGDLWIEGYFKPPLGLEDPELSARNPINNEE